MRGNRVLMAAATSMVVVGLAGTGLGSAATGTVSGPGANTSAIHKAGRYQGKVGTFARIIMKTSKRRVLKLDAGVQGSCQRASDGQILRIELVAMKARPNLRIRRNGKFKGKGQTSAGVSWEVSGRFVSKRKAKGKFEASIFRTIFNPFAPGGFDGELCAGSGKWTARLRR